MNFANVKSVTIPEGAVAKITAGGNTIWQKVTSKLPKEYQELEYIESNGSAAIVTDIVYNDYTGTGQGLIVSAKIMWLGENTDARYFCSMYSPVKSWFHIEDGYYATTQREAWLKSSVKAKANEIIEIEGRVSYDYNGYIKVNGETILSGSRNYGSINFEPANLYLCGYNYNGIQISGWGWAGRCYYSTIKDTSDNLLGEFIPCYRKSDGEIGLYNLVTNTFCAKTGSGILTKGADV